MNLRRTVSTCAVVALSFGLGGTAYSQASSSAQPVTAVTGPPHLASGTMAPATSTASLAQRYARIAAMAARPQPAGAKAVQVPVFRTAGGRPIRLYSAPLQGAATVGASAFASRLGLHGATAGPSGARQDAGAPARNDVCSTPGDGCSTNWSGLEEWTNSQTFTGVSADWTVPDVTATSANPEDTSTWIGIDGDSTFDDNDSPPLIQMGTDSPSDGESPVDLYYEAWYELLPGYEIPLFFVSPGDQMEAVITETSPDVWEMAIADVTAGMAWDYSGISYDSPGFTAEFIQEATTLCPGGLGTCAVSSLQDFGSVPFSDMAYVNSGTVQSQTIYMVDGGGNVLDDPVVSGNSMAVSYGPPAPSSSGVSLTASIPSGFDAMAVDTQSGDVFASSVTSNEVTEISPLTGVIGSVAVDGAGGVVYDATDNEIYVAETSGASPGIYEINPGDISDVGEVAAVPDIAPPELFGAYDIAASLVYEDGALWTTAATFSNLVRWPLTGTATTFSVATEVEACSPTPVTARSSATRSPLKVRPSSRASTYPARHRASGSRLPI